MQISDITRVIEHFAPPALQESYDNAGLIVGNSSADCTGVLLSLDATEAIVDEAIAKGCNLVVSHHPIWFGSKKRLTGRDYVERTIIKAIKHDVALYAAHTNLDHVHQGVNRKIGEKMGLTDLQILSPKPGHLRKLVTMVPQSHLDVLRGALFSAGAGNLGNYSKASFSHPGIGTFQAEAGANPFLGEVGKLAEEAEVRLEVMYPTWVEGKLIAALRSAHPYEEPAFDLIQLQNADAYAGAGMVGMMSNPCSEVEFLQRLKEIFGSGCIRHTAFTGKTVKKVAYCGGAGSFLLGNAIACDADVYVTGDYKYHEFFDADGRLMIADIGHYESEQFTTDIFWEILTEKFPTFAVLKSENNTNPVNYF